MILRKYIIVLLLIATSFLLSPINTLAAQVLQVNSSSLLQIGDRNRTYTVKLSCLEIPPSNEDQAIIWLKSQLKGKKRVNLKPEGVNNGILLARVSLLNSQKDLAQSLIDKGIAKKTC